MSDELSEDVLEGLRRLSEDHYWTEWDRDDLRRDIPSLLSEIRKARLFRKEAGKLLWDIGVRLRDLCEYACDSRNHFHTPTCLRGRINAVFSGERSGREHSEPPESTSEGNPVAAPTKEET